VFQRYGAGFKKKRTMEVDDYKAYLLDEGRLHKRIDIFENITIPSILSQTAYPERDWFRLVVAASEGKPKSVKARLEKLSEFVPGLVVRYVPERKEKIPNIQYISEFLASRKYEVRKHATVRLDDDDAISKNYLARLQGYLDRDTAGFAVSFPAGYEALIQDASVTHVRDKYFPKIGLGLALIGGSRPDSVYAYGQHDRIDRKVPVILDSREPMYLRGIHGENDTGRWVADERVVKVGHHEDVLERFPFLAGQF
jgi:hypothetical protein